MNQDSHSGVRLEADLDDNLALLLEGVQRSEAHRGGATRGIWHGSFNCQYHLLALVSNVLQELVHCSAAVGTAHCIIRRHKELGMRRDADKIQLFPNSLASVATETTGFLKLVPGHLVLTALDPPCNCREQSGLSPQLMKARRKARQKVGKGKHCNHHVRITFHDSYLISIKQG